MKARVLVPLNIRAGKPEILPDNNIGDKYYNEGEIIEITERVIGEKYKNNSTWYKLVDGGFVWSGGVDDTNVKLNLKTLTSLTPTFNYNNLIKNIPEIWKSSGGKGIKVVVMDTGISKEHNDLKIPDSNYFDFLNRASGKYDINGHGTKVAGLIAANTTSNGIKGIAPFCELISFKTLTDANGSSKTTILKTEPHFKKLALENDVILVNGSYSIEDPEQLDKFFRDMPDNIILINAAGDNEELFNAKLSYPASLDNTIAVGFINSLRFPTIMDKRQVNRSLDYIFIGDSLLTTSINNTHEKFSDCSMATALLTGIAALLVSSMDNKKNIKVNFIKEKLNEVLPVIGEKSNEFITIFKAKN